jgi:DNA-binding phage protein
MPKLKETFTRYDTADYLETEEDIAALSGRLQ